MTTEQLDALPSDYQLHWYRIERVLGQGGFGITYLARDANLEQLVAIKEYLPVEFATRAHDDNVQPRTREHQERYEWGLERFISEARTLAKFDHPSIVRVLSVFEHNNTAYMVMRYEQGENLHSMLARRKILEEEALMNIVLPILSGLEEIHSAGFIHRDIKPDNIYIRDDKTPVLLDFGSARQAFGAARTLTILVAPGYAPFEQYYSNSDQQGPWTDIYGLGATLYRAVTGAAPADAIARSKGILGSTRDILVPAAKAAQGRYSQTLLQAIDHALEFSERERPQSIAEWRAELLAKAADPPLAPAHAAGTNPKVPDDASLIETIPHVEYTNSPRELPHGPARPSRWPRIAGVAAMVVAALAIGFVIRPYLQVEPSPGLEQEKPRAEEESRKAEERRLAEEQMRKAEEQRLAEEQMRKAEEQRLAEAQARKAEEQRLAEAQARKAEEDKRLAEQARRKAQEQERREAARKRDASMIALLAAADSDVASNRLSTPPGNNALERYRSVLEMDPGNARASEGIENVVARYVELANQATERGDFDRARGYLDKADAAGAGAPAIASARKHLEEAEQRALTASVREPPASAAPSEPTPNEKLDLAVASYEKSEFSDALRALESLADEHGLARASYYLGLMYARGDGVARNDTSAVEHFREAAEHGYAPAQKSLGVMYATGRGVARDDDEAANWYRRAAEQGNIDAQINLGNMYADGLGVPQSDFEAYAWFAVAAASGNPIARSRRDAVEKKLQPVELEHARKLAGQYEHEFGPSKPSASASIAKVTPAPSAQAPAANGDLAIGLAALENGEHARALKEFRILADESNAQAAYNLGLMYATGKGVSQSDSEAVRWYRKAAEAGYTLAQNSLGVMYASGRGVPRDDDKAHEWYLRAAKKGNADAQINLGNMYAEGRGAARSEFEAYAWYDVAAETGNLTAIDRRDAVAEDLQPVELEHARKLARKYKKNYMVPQ